MGRLELGEGVYGMGLDTVLARKPCADISLKYLKDHIKNFSIELNFHDMQLINYFFIIGQTGTIWH